MKMNIKKFKSIITGAVIISSLYLTAIPVSAWSSSGSFSKVKVSNTGWHVFTLYQKGYCCAEFDITKFGDGKGNIEVDVYSGSSSRTKTFTKAEKKQWIDLDSNWSWNMDATCTASLLSSKGYRTISGEYGFG